MLNGEFFGSLEGNFQLKIRAAAVSEVGCLPAILALPAREGACDVCASFGIVASGSVLVLLGVYMGAANKVASTNIYFS